MRCVRSTSRYLLSCLFTLTLGLPRLVGAQCSPDALFNAGVSLGAAISRPMTGVDLNVSVR
jgi:hypothetical protein